MLSHLQQQLADLKKSDASLRLALTAANAGVWDWNVIEERITLDERLHALRGSDGDAGSLPTASVLDRIHTQDRERVRAALAEAIEQKKEVVCEFRVAESGGGVRHHLARGKALYDGEGRPVRVIGVTQDITEQKLNELVLQEHRARFAGIIESAMDAIISMDSGHRIILFNEAAEKMFGYPAASVIGKPLDPLLPERFRDRHSHLVQEFSRAGITLRRTGHLHPIPGLRANGEEFPIDASISQVEVAGQKIFTVILRDISEQVRSREALESQTHQLREQSRLLDLASVMARTLDDRVILWTSGMEQLTGWRQSEALGKISRELLHTEFAEPLEFIRATLLEHGQWEGELTQTRSDGKKISVASQCVLHRDRQGKPAAILEVNTDITARKQSETEIIRINAELEHRVGQRTAELTMTNQELEAFTYSVAHDLRAPLRHMSAFIRILVDDHAPEISEKARPYLEHIRKGCQNMSQLVDDLLKLARIGRQQLKRGRASLAPLVQDVIQEIHRDTAGRHIEWRVGPLPSAEIDPGLMKQVFANLLANAAKYTRPRHAAIIEIDETDIDGESVIFIRDNGVGFDMKYANKLFGVFQRLHSSSDFEGTGVGLAIVERIIRRHGGRIWAESQPEHGAAFYFTLGGLPVPADSPAAEWAGTK